MCAAVEGGCAGAHVSSARIVARRCAESSVCNAHNALATHLGANRGARGGVRVHEGRPSVKPAPGTVKPGEIAPGWAACVPVQARIRIWYAGNRLASTCSGGHETRHCISTRLEARPAPSRTRRARPQQGGKAQREIFVDTTCVTGSAGRSIVRGARKDRRSGADSQRCECTWHTRGSAAAVSVQARVRVCSPPRRRV
jgi:hypothetical protein